MMQYFLCPQAKTDVGDIWDYIAANWSFDQAEAYIRELKIAIETIAANLGQGRSCGEIRPGYRKYFAGSHILFYRIADSGVDIVRFLRRRMDFERHL